MFFFSIYSFQSWSHVNNWNKFKAQCKQKAFFPRSHCRVILARPWELQLLPERVFALSWGIPGPQGRIPSNALSLPLRQAGLTCSQLPCTDNDFVPMPQVLLSGLMPSSAWSSSLALWVKLATQCVDLRDHYVSSFNAKPGFSRLLICIGRTAVLIHFAHSQELTKRTTIPPYSGIVPKGEDSLTANGGCYLLNTSNDPPPGHCPRGGG